MMFYNGSRPIGNKLALIINKNMELDMENKNQPRVLAYHLAQTIPDDLLQDIAGGGCQPAFTITFKITGPLGQFDIHPDYRSD